MNVSALSEDDSADHDQDIMVVQMLLDDEEAYVTSYLPSPAQVRAESPHAAGLLTYCSGFYNSPRVLRARPSAFGEREHPRRECLEYCLAPLASGIFWGVAIGLLAKSPGGHPGLSSIPSQILRLLA